VCVFVHHPLCGCLPFVDDDDDDDDDDDEDDDDDDDDDDDTPPCLCLCPQQTKERRPWSHRT